MADGAGTGAGRARGSSRILTSYCADTAKPDGDRVWLFCLHIFQARDGVALGGDLLVWLFNMVTGQGIGIVSHLAGTYFQLPVGIGDFFRNQLSFGYGEIGKNAVVLGPAVDIYAHDLPPCKRWGKRLAHTPADKE